MHTQKLESIGKFLSLVLRHKPEKIGIKLDQSGWCDVTELITKSNSYGIKFDIEILKQIVESDSKKRFAFKDNFSKIRASQGHSINIKLGYTSQKPPEILYHGTGEKSVQSILSTGLQKRDRQYVHLSDDITTAKKVGQRHGDPVILKILSGDMYREKFEFFLSDNDVWLTDYVPVKYIMK